MSPFHSLKRFWMQRTEREFVVEYLEDTIHFICVLPLKTKATPKPQRGSTNTYSNRCVFFLELSSDGPV